MIPSLLFCLGVHQCASDSIERQLVSSIWEHIDDILCTGKGDAAFTVRQLRSALPPLDSFPSHALGPLAQLHLQSSQDLTATAKLLLPGAFKGAAAALDVAALGDVDGSVLGLLSNLIELQLFHLLRAQAITREMRTRIAAKHHHHQQQQVDQQGTGCAAVSSSSDCCCDSDMSMGYLE